VINIPCVYNDKSMGRGRLCVVCNVKQAAYSVSSRMDIGSIMCSGCAHGQDLFVMVPSRGLLCVHCGLREGRRKEWSTCAPVCHVCQPVCAVLKPFKCISCGEKRPFCGLKVPERKCAWIRWCYRCAKTAWERRCTPVPCRYTRDKRRRVD